MPCWPERSGSHEIIINGAIHDIVYEGALVADVIVPWTVITCLSIVGQGGCTCIRVDVRSHIGNDLRDAVIVEDVLIQLVNHVLLVRRALLGGIQIGCVGQGEGS